MKNVILKASLIVNCLSLALVAKYWSPIKGLINSQPETPSQKTVVIKEQKPDPAKAILKEAMLAQRNEIETCYDDYLRREPKNQNG